MDQMSGDGSRLQAAHKATNSAFPFRSVRLASRVGGGYALVLAFGLLAWRYALAARCRECAGRLL